MNLSLHQALKYTTDTVANLLEQFQHPQMAAVRTGVEQHPLRGFLADALRDAAGSHTDRKQIEDLHRQADLLADEKQHVVVKDGRVRAGRPGSESLEPGLQQINQRMAEINLPFGPVSLEKAEAGRYRLVDASDFLPPIGADVKHLSKSLSRYLNGGLENSVGYAPSPAISKLQEAAFTLRHTPAEEVDTDHPSEKQ